ncbi:MAG: esterase-like activity of phytase family protein [Betaproteobacteria bacterium]|nr:esterase-like activity of phytase family protein [Betaproteobacteria bacterium]
MNRQILIGATLVAAAWAPVVPAQSFQLTGWAEIEHTFRQPGPVSGQFTSGPVNGVTPPYAGQPIPGFSGMIPSVNAGNFYGLPDNGFGAQGNSADFVLGFYEVTPHFKTVGDGTTSRGSVTVNSFTPFSDPNGLLLAGNYIANGPVYNRTNYYPTGAQIAVDPSIKNGKWLTGADFDVESFSRMNDGSIWVGEEFGPYLLHFNAQGQLLSAPIAHPVLRAPQNPAGGTNLPSSRGFESMTRNGDGSKLYLTTEASINSQTDKRMLEIYEFDTTTEQYTGTSFAYAKDSSDTITGAVNNASNIFVTGDMTHVADDRYLIIERDDFQGPVGSASYPYQKKIYLIDLSETDENGVLEKKLLVDLLDVPDPKDIGGPLVGLPADKFNFPLQSVESITLIDEHTILVGLDNNYPGGNGRVLGTPDGTEMITIRFDQSLHTMPVPEPETYALMLAGLGILAGVARKRSRQG